MELLKKQELVKKIDYLFLKRDEKVKTLKNKIEQLEYWNEDIEFIVDLEDINKFLKENDELTLKEFEKKVDLDKDYIDNF